MPQFSRKKQKGRIAYGKEVVESGMMQEDT